MPYNGSGTYTPPGASFPAVANTLIESTKWNNVVNDIATALSTAITKDGQTTITANLPMGGYRHTGVGAPSARDHYSTVAFVQDASAVYVAAGGTADAITLTLSPAITAYAEGQLFGFRATATNTSTTPTLNVNGVGAKTIVQQDGTALVAGTITSGRLYLVQYYNNNWRMVGAPPLAVGTSSGQVLRWNGSAWAATTLTISTTAGTSGTLIQSNGSAWINTLATYPSDVSAAGKFLRASAASTWEASTLLLPNAVTGAGQIMRADGANSFAASTMTYPDTITDKWIPFATGSNQLGSGTAQLTFNASTCVLKVDGQSGDADIPEMQVYQSHASGGALISAYAPNGYDAYAAFTAIATKTWAVGIDGSDSNSFHISQNATPGASSSLIMRTDGSVGFPAISTTASAANAYIDNGGTPTNNLLRSTSSLRYKKDVEPVDDFRIDAVLQLNPIWYRSKCPGDRKDWSWYGLGAEDVAAIDPRLVHWTREQIGTDEHGGAIFGDKLIPDGVMYERVAVLLLGVVKRLDAEVQALKAAH